MSGWSVTVSAPAKLTLSLCVLGRRPDGFHELEALTVTVTAPADRLTVRDAEAGVVTLVLEGGGPDVPDDDANLAVRAARAVLPPGEGVHLELAKAIPSGAGLGGGSADAGAVLRVLRDRHGLEPDAVQRVAAGLGSDVPVCVEGRPVMMRGRGEILEAVEPAADLDVVVATPGFGLATPAVYRAWDELAGSGRARSVPAPDAVAHLVPILVNDLEPAAERVEPRLAAFRDALAGISGGAPLLAGSGSSYWLPCRDADTAVHIAARVRDELGVQASAGRVVRGSPG